MKISRYRTDPELESTGVWVELGEGGSIKVARMNNDKYRAMMRQVSKPYRRQLQLGVLDEEVARDLVNKCMAACVLLDWEGIEDDEGKAIKHSEEKALELLRDVPDFRAVVLEVASEMETFRAVEQEADEGN
jgi:hypothetical protein